jgi:iron complex outermembrane receptor protein
VGKAESKGVEMELTQKFTNEFNLFANTTLTKGKILDNDVKPTTVGKKMAYLPARVLNAGAEFSKGHFGVTLTSRYISKRYSNDENKDSVNGVYTAYDSFSIMDAKVSYKFTKYAVLSLSVDNVFDRDYFDYYKAPGRSWFAEVTVRY